MYPKDLACYDDLKKQPDIMSKGGSAIYGPNGDVLAGPLVDKAGILYAELDLASLPKNRYEFDVVGHYARPDVFRLLVNKEESVRVEKENV
jgi:nitrilase